MRKLFIVPLMVCVCTNVYAANYYNPNPYNQNVTYYPGTGPGSYTQTNWNQGQTYNQQGQDYYPPQAQQGYEHQNQRPYQGQQYQGYEQQQDYYPSQGYQGQEAYNQGYPQEAGYQNWGWNQQQPTQGNYNDNRTANADSKYPQDRATSDRDRELNARIREKITGWLTNNFKNVALKTNNGVVVIEGTVDNVDDKKTLNDEVRKITGVVAINDYVQVVDSNARNAAKEAAKYPQDRFISEADRQINNKIRDKISGWFTNDYKNISLNTSNGNVSISGYVDSLDAQKKLSDEVRKIEGVKAVSNNTQVRK